MKYLDLIHYFKNCPFFSITDIKKIDNSFHRRRLNEWQEKWYIKKVIKGYYIFSDSKLDENIIFNIANRIYSPS